MSELYWLCADYHFPSIYSIKDPTTSAFFAKAMPGPGPSTVRMALISAGIQTFGIDYMRDELFETIKSIKILISPPDKIAITSHIIRGMKPNGNNLSFSQSLINREYAQAFDCLSIYLLVPEQLKKLFTVILKRIGYWGQSESIAYCIRVVYKQPDITYCAAPLQELNHGKKLASYFLTFSAEFKDGAVSWDLFLKPNLNFSDKYLAIYPTVWPLKIIKRGVDTIWLSRSRL